MADTKEPIETFEERLHSMVEMIDADPDSALAGISQMDSVLAGQALYWLRSGVVACRFSAADQAIDFSWRSASRPIFH